MNKNSFNGIVIDNEQRFTETVSFGNVRINGAAEFTETVEANEIDVSGVALFDNFTTCDRLTVDGRAAFKKKLLTETIRNTGDYTCYGKLTGDVVVNSGVMRLFGSSSLGRVLVKEGGSLSAVSRVKVDRMTVNGTISVIGGIKGEKLEIISPSVSSVDSVYAETLYVRWDSDGEKNSVLNATEIDVIDADIEYTDIDILYCDSVSVGPGCHIRQLYYRKNISVNSDSFVERLIKV